MPRTEDPTSRADVERIKIVLRDLQPGEIASYSQIAAITGLNVRNLPNLRAKAMRQLFVDPGDQLYLEVKRGKGIYRPLANEFTHIGGKEAAIAAKRRVDKGLDILKHAPIDDLHSHEKHSNAAWLQSMNAHSIALAKTLADKDHTLAPRSAGNASPGIDPDLAAMTGYTPRTGDTQ